MEPDGNVYDLYGNIINLPDINILSQLEISSILQQVLVELRSLGQSNSTETLLLNLINEKLDDCPLCLRLRINLTRIAREIANTINYLRPMRIPININSLPVTLVIKIRDFAAIISQRSEWHY
jgi:hypothetical protein